MLIFGESFIFWIMRIFLVSNMFPSKDDPLFGVFVKNFKNELENQGIIFTMASLIKGKKKSPWNKLINYLIHYLDIMKKGLSSSKYDLIYVHFLSHHIPILYFLGIIKKPLIINLHGTDFIAVKNSPFLTALSKPILRRAKAIVVPTSYFSNLVEEHFRFIKSPQIIISPSGGIDKNVFYLKQGQQNSSNVITLGFVSRFIEEKGWRTYLESLEILEKNQISFKGIIAGKGPDEHRIKKCIHDLNLTPKIKFLGLVEQKKLVDIYNEMDLYIFPTYREAESLGLTGLEAMACGVPNIACNIAGPSTYIVPGKNGFLFPVRDAASLAEKIMAYYYMEPSEKQAMSEMAELTTKKYGKGNIAKQLIESLKEIV